MRIYANGRGILFVISYKNLLYTDSATPVDMTSKTDIIQQETKAWIRLETVVRNKRQRKGDGKGSEREMERAAKEHRKNVPSLRWAPQQSADWLFNRPNSMVWTLNSSHHVPLLQTSKQAAYQQLYFAFR